MGRKWLGICLCICMLCGCGQGMGETADPQASPVSPGVVENLYYGRIAAVEDGHAYLAGEKGGDLIALSMEGLKIIDPSGKELETEAVCGGMDVKVAFDGTIMETYPARLSRPTRMTVLGQEGDRVGLYRKAVWELYQEEGEWNGDTYLAFDLTRSKNLSDTEQEALLYLLGNDLSQEVLEGTKNSLAEEGYIEESAFPHGTLITVEDGAPDDRGGFSFSIHKWSSRGTVSWKDCEARFDGAFYSYKIGEREARESP